MRMDEIHPGKWYRGKGGQARGVVDVFRVGHETWQDWKVAWIPQRPYHDDNARYCKLQTFARWAISNIHEPKDADNAE